MRAGEGPNGQTGIRRPSCGFALPLIRLRRLPRKKKALSGGWMGSASAANAIVGIFATDGEYFCSRSNICDCERRTWGVENTHIHSYFMS